MNLNISQRCDNRMVFLPYNGLDGYRLQREPAAHHSPAVASFLDGLVMESDMLLLEDRRFYVYLHLRATDGSVFYVGKGQGGRSHEMAKRNPWHKNVAAKHGVDIIIVREDMTDKEAIKLEIETISKLKAEGVRLVNRTGGGDGAANLNHDIRKIIGKKISEHWKNPAYRERHSKSKAEASMQPKAIEKRKNAGRKLSAKYLDPAYRAAHSAKMKAVHGTPNAIAENRERAKKIWASSEARNKASESARKRWADPKQRLLRSQSAKAQFACPIKKQKNVDARNAALRTPEARAKNSAIQKIAQNRPDVLAKKKAIAIDRFKTQESRDRVRLKTLEQFSDPANREKARKASLMISELRRAYCQEFGISNPGRGYCNIPKDHFNEWRAARAA